MFQIGKDGLTMEDSESRGRTYPLKSEGSYDIVEFEDPAFEGRAANLVDSHVVENFRLMSRENSSEDYVMVVTRDPLKSSSVLSVCDSLSTLTMSTESFPSAESSTCSMEDSWERQERATDPPHPPHPPSSHQSIVNGSLTGQPEEGGLIHRTSLLCRQTVLEDVECGREDERDGLVEHSVGRGNVKYHCNGIVNHMNNCHSENRTGSNTFPRQSQHSSFGSLTSSQSTATTHVPPPPPPRLAKSNSPHTMAETRTRCNHKIRSAKSEGTDPESFSPKHRRERRTDPARTYLKTKPAHDVCRAFSEPNEKDILDGAQLKLVEKPEWLLKLSSTTSSGSTSSGSTSSVSTSSGVSYGTPEPSSPEPSPPEPKASCTPQLSHVDDSGPPTEEAIKKCIEQHSADFLQYTNWNCLFPYLMSNQLLDRYTTEILGSDRITTMDKGIKFYYQVLPTKGKRAYSRYYDSVAQEQDHIGHQTLLELLDKFGRTS